MPPLNELTHEELSRLYKVELFTEQEIAIQYGTYQVKINRLRKRWGINTLGKTGRLAQGLPSFTDVQEQVLIGSLLGDGGMTATSKASARFTESHSLKQVEYLDWKAEVLGQYVSSVWPTTKTNKETGKVYRGKGFTSKACPQLRPFYDLFYPLPDRKRVFPSDLYMRLTPLVLAVWYMDDGSLTTGGHPRLHFGLDELSLWRARRAFRTLGLDTTVYGDRGDKVLWFPKNVLKFREIVEPHIHPSMVYKLPPVTKRRVIDRNARRLTAEKAESLYLGGMTVQELAEAYGVGRSTVNRRLNLASTKRRKRGPRVRAYTLEAAEAMLGGFDLLGWQMLSEGKKDEGVQRVLGILRKAPFPFPPEPTLDRVRGVLDKIRGADQGTEGDTLTSRSWMGTPVCGPFFPNRYKARNLGKPSAYHAWHDDKELVKAIRFQLDHGDPVVPHRILRAVQFRVRTPTVFRPLVARWVYENYAKPGERVWDPCMGYGGRVLGAVAAGVEYTGTDVEPETVAGNQKIADLLKYPVDIHCYPAEEFVPPEVGLVFTSPPYFTQELYAGGQDQSWRRYGDSFQAWVEGFLRPVIRSSGGAHHLVLNVADLRRGKKVIPLVNTTIQVAEEEGFKHTRTVQMPLPSINRVGASEPLLIFVSQSVSQSVSSWSQSND